jgi:hypothetical protein
MAAKGTETAEVFAAPMRDRVNNVTPGAKKGDLKRCIVIPRSSDENAERGTVIIEGYTVWAPAPVAIEVTALDVVKVRGKQWSIEGVPGDWRNRRG